MKQRKSDFSKSPKTAEKVEKKCLHNRTHLSERISTIHSPEQTQYRVGFISGCKHRVRTCWTNTFREEAYSSIHQTNLQELTQKTMRQEGEAEIIRHNKQKTKELDCQRLWVQRNHAPVALLAQNQTIMELLSLIQQQILSKSETAERLLTSDLKNKDVERSLKVRVILAKRMGNLLQHRALWSRESYLRWIQKDL